MKRRSQSERKTAYGRAERRLCDARQRADRRFGIENFTRRDSITKGGYEKYGIGWKTGEATPSGWQPGKPTLKPGPDLVGKVWKVWKPEMGF